ncbi:MAG: phosphatidate cytidylyltransferase [Verrucomicrobia bacterium]|nr:phosphatidate cytidylyltransferase [Verrucomicrobiota bacterium]
MSLKRMADLNRRLIVSSVVGIAVAALIAFSSNSAVSLVLMLVVAALAGIGVWEYAQLALEKEIKPRARLMVIFAAMEVAAFYASLVFVDFPQLPVLVLACAAIVFFIVHFNQTSNALANIAVQFFGVCYVAVPLSLLLGVLYPFPHHGATQEGKWWLAYLIVVTKITDVGAYFVGRLWGAHKLAPSLSPKKTMEGAIAGLICAVLMSIGMHFLGVNFSGGTFHLTLTESVWLGILIGIFGQVGDLAESLLKRDAVVKDSHTLPGLGGILAMVDSLLLTTPIVYFFLCMH